MSLNGLLGNPMFMAGMGALQGQTPQAAPPNFAANVMGGLQGAASNRMALDKFAMEKKKFEAEQAAAEQRQAQLQAQQDFLARINGGGQPQAPTAGLPNLTPPRAVTGMQGQTLGQIPGERPTSGQLPQIPAQSPSQITGQQQDPTSTYVNQRKAELARIESLLSSGNIPDMATYNSLLQAKDGINKEIYEATKPENTTAMKNALALNLVPGTEPFNEYIMKATLRPQTSIAFGDADRPVDTPQLQYYRRPTEDGGWENPEYPLTVDELKDGGFKYVSPKVVEAENANIDEYNKALQASAVFAASIPVYEAALDKIGIAILPGKEKQELESAFTQMQMVAKNYYELGVLSGPDLEIMEAIANSPTTALSWWIEQKDGDLAGFKSQLRSIEKNIGEKMKMIAHIRGIDPERHELEMLRLKYGSK